MRHAGSVIAIGTLMCMGAACSGVLELEEILGLWELESVNGFGVPGDITVYTHDNIPRTIRVNDFRITLRNNGTCRSEHSRGSVFSDQIYEGAQDCDYHVDLSAGVIQIVDQPPDTISASEMVLVTYEDDPGEKCPNEWLYRKQ